MAFKSKQFGSPLNLIIIFCILTVLIIISGFYFYRTRLEKNKSDIYSNLAYITKLKADQINSWRSERLVDANDIQANQSLINDIRDWFQNKKNHQAESRIKNWIQYLSSNIEINYDRVSLLSKSFEIELSSSPNKNLEDWERQSLKQDLNSGKIQFTDLYRVTRKNPVEMDLIIPLLYPDNKNGESIGLLLISIDPRKVLFPLIKTWPSESKSAETLLIRPDGDSVLFLNDLRGKNNTALNYKLPLSMVSVPSVQAALGRKGIFEGTDYRGIQVMSYIVDIPNVNWMMITKVDLDESLAPLRKTTLLILSFGIIIILITGSTLSYIWKNQQSKFYKEKFNLESESKKAMRESETKFRYLAESITDIFFAMDKDFKLTYWNKASEKMSGILAKDALGRSIYDIFPNVKGNKTEKFYLEVLRTKSPKAFINEFQSDGKSFAFEVSVYSSSDGLSVFTRDISEQRRVEEAIRESEERYRSLFENMLGGFAFCRMIYDAGEPYDFIYLQVNKTFEKMTTLKNVIGKKATDIIPGLRETNPELFEIYGRVAITGKIERFETYLPALNIWFVISVYSPATEFFIAIFEDITERKIAEKTIKASLKEKEVLLRELYHRTKNNMQVISSLMGLKADSIKDEQMIGILDEMKNRIQTIALVHQKLYQSQNLSRVDLKEYITDLVSLLSNSYAVEKERIKFTLDLETVDVLIDTAIPCGLIINELISNSFKHAFPVGRKGNIFVRLAKLEGGTIELKISDDGVGVNNGFDLMQKNTLGIQLFHNIAIDQLMADIQIDTKNGLEFTLTFQDIAYQERV